MRRFAITACLVALVLFAHPAHAEPLACRREIALYFGPNGPTPAAPPLGACRRAIGKEAARFLVAKSKTLRKCWDARLRGVHQNPCPDPGAATAIAAAAAKMTGAICAACGG